MVDVMVIAVHPDDETLGCGGTLLWHRSRGDNIHLLIITSIYNHDNGNRAYTIGSDDRKHDLPDYMNFSDQNTSYSDEKIRTKSKEIAAMIENYRFSSVKELRVPTTNVFLQEENVLVQKVASHFKKIRPNILYIPFLHDAHGDHRAIFPILNSCIKTFRYPFIEKIYMMETISETEYAPSLPGYGFIPNHFVCIDEYIELKLAIMANYKSEVQVDPLPRSIEMIKAQSRFRGSAAHCKYAEAFMLLKEIVR